MSGAARATMKAATCVRTPPERVGESAEPPSCQGSGLVILPVNEEFPVSASHQLALIKSLPFVHTARRYYQSEALVRPSDCSPARHGSGRPRSTARQLRGRGTAAARHARAPPIGHAEVARQHTAALRSAPRSSSPPVRKCSVPSRDPGRGRGPPACAPDAPPIPKTGGEEEEEASLLPSHFGRGGGLPFSGGEEGASVFAGAHCAGTYSMGQPRRVSTQSARWQGLWRRPGRQLRTPTEPSPGRRPAVGRAYPGAGAPSRRDGPGASGERWPPRNLEVSFRGGGRPRGSALAVADGSHAFVRVAVRSLTVPRGAPHLTRGGAGAPNV